MAFQWIQYDYPVEYLFEKMILWVDSPCRLYFALKETDDGNWIFYSGTSSHNLDSGSKLINRGTSESSAQANYWRPTPDSNHKILALLPIATLAKYVRVYIDDTNDAPTQIYEFRPSTVLKADEIVTGELLVTDAYERPPVITVKADGTDRIKLGYLGNTYGLRGYDSSGSQVFELSASVRHIAGFTVQTNTIASGTGVILDSTNKKISINATTFENQGIQLDYNSGTPRFYAGDGSNKYFKYDGTNISWKGINTELTTSGSLNVSNLQADGGTIAGWEITATKLRSSSSGRRIELNESKDRISVFDATNNEKVVMGYLNGLTKNASPSEQWGSDDYGFYAVPGDHLKIDGNATYFSGDWIIKHNAAYKVLDASDNEILRLGTSDNKKGLFIWDNTGTLLAEYHSDGFLIGDTTKSGNYVEYTEASGLVIKGSITITATNSEVPWDSITGPNKPEDNADVTASHTANNTNYVASIPSGNIAGWAHSSDITYINGGKLYSGSEVSIGSGGFIRINPSKMYGDTNRGIWQGYHSDSGEYRMEIYNSEDDFIRLTGGDVEGSGYFFNKTLIPNGAIVPFDASLPIPNGWVEFTDANGKHIIGAGNSYSVGDTGGDGNDINETLTTSTAGSHDGEPSHFRPYEDTIYTSMTYMCGRDTDGDHFHHITNVTYTRPYQQLKLIKATSDRVKFPAGAIVFTNTTTVNGDNLSAVYTDKDGYLLRAGSSEMSGGGTLGYDTTTSSDGDHTHLTSLTTGTYPGPDSNCNRYDSTYDHAHSGVSLSISSETLKKVYLKAWKGSADFRHKAGHIIMYIGSTAPSGWLLCDGNNGTPDLRDYFLVFSNDTNVGTSSSDPNRINFTGSMNSNTWNHYHTYTIDCTLSGSCYRGHDSKDVDHTHSVSTYINHTPDYYALTFIMKATE